MKIKKDKKAEEPVEVDQNDPKARLEEVMSQSLKKQKVVPKNIKKPLTIAAVVIAIGVLGSVVASSLIDNSIKTTDTPVVAPVIEKPKLVQLSSAIGLVEGTVEHSLDGETWEAAEAGGTLAAQEYIRTGAESRTVLIMDDGSAVRLDASTEVQLIVSDANTTDVMLVGGQVYSRVVESDTRTFAVVTENERFEAKGTAYTTSTDGTKDELKVFQSKVLVDSDDMEIDEGNKYDTETKQKESIDLDGLTDDEFVKWNKEQDEQDSNFKDKLGVLDIIKDKKEEEVVTPPVVVDPGAAISLSGNQSDSGVKLSWSLSGGASASDGYKVVYDKFSAAPTYKTHTAQYVGSGSKSTTVQLKDGATYYFRVCAYRADAGSCDTYSNAIQVTAPVIAVEAVQPGAVALNITGNSVDWSFAGTAPHGFKLVLSGNTGPTYPSNSVQYHGPGTANATLPEKPAGTYYVRICKYTADSEISGGCTDYSNEVQYVIN